MQYVAKTCHLFIIISFELTNLENANCVAGENTQTSTRYCFDAIDIVIYKLSVQDTLTAGKMNEIINEIASTESDINSIIKKCPKLLIGSSECCRKTYANKQSKHNPWFDVRYRRLKVDKSKLLKRYRKTRSNKDLNNYKQNRVEFKNQCRLSKANYKREKLESLIELYGNKKTF